MRRVAIVLAVLLVLPLQAAGQSSPPSPTCIGESEAIHVAGFATRAGSFLIVDLTLSNRSSGPIRVDPSRITLQTDRDFNASPMSAGDAKKAALDLGSHVIGLVFLGPLAVVVSAASVIRFNREIDARILRAEELPSQRAVLRSLYFKVPDERIARITAQIDGMITATGDQLPLIRLRCGVKTSSPEGDQYAPGSLATVRTVSSSAQASAGPVRAAVSVVEFWPDVTMVDVVLSNSAEVEADVFSPLANATLTDQSGKTVAVRLIRSEFPERVPARSSAAARLAFEALPQQTTAATLTIPGIRVGERAYEMRAHLRFQF